MLVVSSVPAVFLIEMKSEKKKKKKKVNKIKKKVMSPSDQKFKAV